MRANRVPASRGIAWIGEGFMIFRAAPIRQLLMNLAFLFAITFAVAIPVLGFAVVWLLFPALAVGPHALSRAAERGETLEPGLLLAGFRAEFGAQLRLGGAFLAVMLLVLLATAIADGGHFAQAMIGRVQLEIADLQKPELQDAMLIGAALQSALLALLWYAPLLVAWDRMPAVKAVFFSTVAAFINWRAFLVYALGLSTLFAAALMLALGAAMLLAGGRGVQGNAALFGVIWTLLPIWFASSYVSYRDVFAAAPEEPEAAG
jgi:hypothetical protein